MRTGVNNKKLVGFCIIFFIVQSDFKLNNILQGKVRNIFAEFTAFMLWGLLDERFGNIFVKINSNYNVFPARSMIGFMILPAYV